MSRVQSWIETTDPDLYGDAQDIGVVRTVREDRAAKIQKDTDQERYINRRVQVISLIGAAVGLLKILELFHIIPK